MINRILNFIKNIFGGNICPKCQKGKIKYIGDDFTGITWTSIYECNHCKTEYV